MKLHFFNPTALDKNLKATIHKSGKLGFTIEAAKKLNLSETKSASIGINEDDPHDTNLYVIINDYINNNVFKINKAGAYFYINTKALFDKMKIDYSKGSTAYDITSDKIDGDTVFIFKRRQHRGGNQKNNPSTQTSEGS